MIPFELTHRLYISILLRERERERESEKERGRGRERDDDANRDSSIRIVYTHIDIQIFFSK